VVNEEMYEEEDDDLPMQYRRLTAHLQTGSADFNRRLSAYLTNHVAMRSALDQAITNSYAQQYPNAPQFAHNQQSMYPSPFLAHNMQQQQQSPTSYVQSPYMAQNTPAFRAGQPVRSASAAGTQDTPGYTQPATTQSSPIDPSASADLRRTSMPTKMPSKSVSPVASRTPQPLQSRPTVPPKTSSFPPNQQIPAYSNVRPDGQPNQQMRAPPQPQINQQPTTNMFGFQDFSPFTTALPTESQMLLGSALDPNDPLTSMFMAGSENMPMPNYYNTTPASLMKQRNFHPSYDGMSATLAPSALDMSPAQGMFGNPPATTSVSMGKPGFQLPYDGSFPDFTKGQQMFGGGTSSNGSGAATPGLDGTWDAFINDNTWNETST